MGSEVVYLKYSNKNAEEDNQSLIACKNCRNKTYRVIWFMNDYPLLQCAACDAHIGRFGWAPQGQE